MGDLHKEPEAEAEAELDLWLLCFGLQLHRAALVSRAVHIWSGWPICSSDVAFAATGGVYHDTGDPGNHSADAVVLGGSSGHCNCQRLQERGRHSSSQIPNITPRECQM